MDDEPRASRKRRPSFASSNRGRRSHHTPRAGRSPPTISSHDPPTFAMSLRLQNPLGDPVVGTPWLSPRAPAVHQAGAVPSRTTEHASGSGLRAVKAAPQTFSVLKNLIAGSSGSGAEGRGGGDRPPEQRYGRAVTDHIPPRSPRRRCDRRSKRNPGDWRRCTRSSRPLGSQGDRRARWARRTWASRCRPGSDSRW
jgi:hypothetical protein